ncbi:MAG: hypothetical protein KIY12_10200 [Thermoplasmata archaeon]|uniref:Uncharacterized protein n=1 Tax=Candidatus Sysuiplasma superficiale TaxID=2823368 RepID=A0A8J7YNQ3_9ARCH|nr:hypothetical protein [Candidatus Sysuiplasma superficiale]MBX8645068.1 hypothetical protein [Candidatus Sysuiplasma superficiale]MCL5437291.1 hypothetical protein [Candidatus Thermoplasmatota archaeon]
MQGIDTAFSLTELERLQKRIETKLRETQSSSASGESIESLQKRAVMQLQQFYKLLLSDYSPTQFKEMHSFLKANGFPELRDALRMKPAKMAERLKEPVERLECEEQRKRQLAFHVSRIEETVRELDEEIFNYSRFSKKEMKLIDELEDINSRIGEILSLRDKISDLQVRREKLLARVPAPEGLLDVHSMVRERLESKKKELVEERDEIQSELGSLNNDETAAMENLRLFLHSSAALMDPVVKILPRIRFLTSSVVKSSNTEITEWDVGVALQNLKKIYNTLDDDDPVRIIGPERSEQALQYILDHPEAVSDYNRVLGIRSRKEALKERLVKIEERIAELQSPEAENAELSVVNREVEKNISMLRQTDEDLDSCRNELTEHFQRLKEVDGFDSVTSLSEEVDRMIKKLQP